MWTFEQSTGKLYNPDGTHVATGYSGGDCGKCNAWINSPDSQENHGGTIPQGIYHRGILVPHSQLGVDAIELIPDPSNTMFGRSGFFMHGDNQQLNDTASEGCIIMPHDIRESFLSSNDADLEVVAEKIA